MSRFDGIGRKQVRWEQAFDQICQVCSAICALQAEENRRLAPSAWVGKWILALSTAEGVTLRQPNQMTFQAGSGN
jgi:hypothetical protein